MGRFMIGRSDVSLHGGKCKREKMLKKIKFEEK